MFGRSMWLSVSVVLVVTLGAHAETLRIANWNVTNYESGRVSEFETAIYDSYAGRSMSPDILIGQEYISQTGVNNFLSILNNAPGSPGDWAAAPFVDGADTDSAFFYRTSKVTYLGMTVVAVGSSSPSNHPRNIQRYDVRPIGHSTPESTLAIYSTHMKAGSGTTEEARRLIEAERIRDDAEALPAGWNFLIGGDFNIPTSSEAAYQELVGSQANNDGRFWDPIKTPGNWSATYSYRFVHTQDPSVGHGGMDDRYDLILVSASLIDGSGVDYDGNANVAYSTSTWNDANHSYRSWGNDGTSFNDTLTTTGNAMVGATIAQALVDSAAAGGHLPIFLDLDIPATNLGACCTDCGCEDYLSEAECIAAGGDFRGASVLCGEEVPECPTPSNDKRINEVLIVHDGAPQNGEFVELIGTPGDVLCGLSVVVIEGQGLSKGKVKFVQSLDDCGGDTCVLDAEGRFVIGGTGVVPTADLLIPDYSFEEGTETFALIRDTQLSSSVLDPYTDVDANYDCVVDIDPAAMGTVIDAVGLIDINFAASGCVYFGAPEFGPDPTSSPTAPAGVARCPDGVDTDTLADWVGLGRATDGSDGCVAITPSAANDGHCGGDYDGDGDVDLDDFGAFQVCFDQTDPSCAALGLDGVCGPIDLADFAVFVSRLTGP